MADRNKLFLLFFSLMIFSVHAIDVIISGAHRNFKQRSEIKTNITNGQKVYGGTLNPLTYEAGVNISNVIIYIIDRSRYVEIIRRAVREPRLQIARELKLWHYELVFLGIESIDDDEHHLIGAFILDKIRPNRNQINQNLIIKVIGENDFDRSYQSLVALFERYQENVRICGGALLARLRNIHHGALTPVANYNRVMKLRGYEPSTEEVTWPFRVVNGTYFPEVDITTPEYNIKLRHPDNNINLLVLGGKEYAKVTSLHNQSMEILAISTYLLALAGQNEVFYIMGAFNFDWTEVHIVTHIILQHTQGWQVSDHNVFACGFGMFDTNYLNRNPEYGRFIFQPREIVLRIRKELLGQVGERYIIMRYFDRGRKSQQIPINSSNGQYAPEAANENFPWLNLNIAFIVYNQAEVNGPIDDRVVYYNMRRLRRYDIFVILIEANNFGLHDIHIIAEWIEQHKGRIDSEQIAVLGGGTFDSIFQSKRTTFNTFFNIGKNELRMIRNAHVKRGNEKKILVARIDNENFEAWSFPMNTVVNGFYEPDLIPDRTMFDTSNGRILFFIITSADNFHRISAIPNVGAVTATFRGTINDEYPLSNCSVILVGLDNFGMVDAHRFAEFVNAQTDDERPLATFVRIMNYGTDTVPIQYDGAEPFIIDQNPRILSRFTWLLRTTV